MKQNITIQDVARLSGFSTATVSRVLSEADYKVNPHTCRKIKEAASALGYIPNAAAKALRKNIRQDIGVIIPNLTNPFYMQALLGINEVLAERGYDIILCNSFRKVQTERDCLKRLSERQVAGVIISSIDDSCNSIQEHIQRGMHFILLDQCFDGLQVPGIHFDSRAGARIAVEHLVSQGHQEIAFATLPLTRWTRSEMHCGYQEALAIAGIPYDKKRVFIHTPIDENPTCDLELEAGLEFATQFVQQGCPATAILCINDMIAMGMIKGLIKQGIRIPEDVSVIGFDDIPLSSAFSPALTTIQYPAVQTGRLAALMLLDSIENHSCSSEMSMNLTPKLIIRDTVAPK